MKKDVRSLGWGSLSLLLFIVSVLFSYLTLNKKLLGEHVLNYLDINMPAAIVTVILLILAVVIGNRFNNHIFAKSGKVLSLILLSLFALMTL